MIDRVSGTIRARAVFANAAGLFTPGMFAPRSRPGLATLRGAAGARRRDRHRAGAQVRAGGRGRQHRVAALRHARRRHRRSAGDQVRRVGRGSHHRQRHGAGAAGRQGRAAGPGRRRAAGEEPTRPSRDEDLAFLHRPADLRLGRLDRVRHPRAGVVLPPAGRAISRDRAADHQRGGPVSGRQRRHGRHHRGGADRGADQRRREHALHVVELDRRRPLHHRGHLRPRHQSRHRPGAGAEPRRHRPAAPAAGGAPDRRHRQQEPRPT